MNAFSNPKHAVAVTPSNTVNLASESVIYVGSGGNVKILPAIGSSAVTLVAVKSGTTIPFVVKRVYASGTTASNMVAGF